MTLREMLEIIDFDYVIEEDEIRLIDQTEVYLGTIAEERWPAEQGSIPEIGRAHV